MNTSEHKISIQPGYVLVERPDDYEAVSSSQPAMLMELSVACKEAGCRKVMILGSSTKVRLSVPEIIELGEGIAKIGLRIAVVEKHDASAEDVELLENVATNRGGPIQFFDNEEDAKVWLSIQ